VDKALLSPCDPYVWGRGVKGCEDVRGERFPFLPNTGGEKLFRVRRNYPQILMIPIYGALIR
jgi:hypothetical protein